MVREDKDGDLADSYVLVHHSPGQITIPSDHNHKIHQDRTPVEEAVKNILSTEIALSHIQLLNTAGYLASMSARQEIAAALLNGDSVRTASLLSASGVGVYNLNQEGSCVCFVCVCALCVLCVCVLCVCCV